MTFPYPPGKWFVGDVAPPDEHGVRRSVAFDERINNWLQSKGFVLTETYGVSTVSWSEKGSVWGVFVHRFAQRNGGPFIRFGRVAKRVPRLVRP